MTEKQLCGRSWVDASEFHALQDHHVLEEVYRRAIAWDGGVVFLDLDSTLYEVGPRTHRILTDWAKSGPANVPPGIQAQVLDMRPDQVGYAVRDCFVNLGLEESNPENGPILMAAQEFWFQNFFTDSYLTFDRPYPGAASFVQRLHRAGVEIVYLTGRDHPNMGRGTRENLLRDGFPLEVPGVELLMKPSFPMDDLSFKKQAASDYVNRRGPMVASFENEPPNVVALAQIFPEAMHVFVDTVCGPTRTTPAKGLYRVSGFGSAEA